MNKLLTPELKTDLEAGIETIRADGPTDLHARDKAIAAMLELQLRKAQSIEVRGLKLNGWVAVLAFAAIVIATVIAVDIPDCIRAWKGSQVEATK
jgi:hypothetical protein